MLAAANSAKNILSGKIYANTKCRNFNYEKTQNIRN
jgi:hypothetical protein